MGVLPPESDGVEELFSMRRDPGSRGEWLSVFCPRAHGPQSSDTIAANARMCERDMRLNRARLASFLGSNSSAELAEHVHIVQRMFQLIYLR